MSRTLCRKATARAALGAIACVAAALVAGIADAAETESLDPSFGNSGRVTTAVAGRDAAIEAMALQADGRSSRSAGLVTVTSSAFPPRMDFLAVRYNVDGTLDSAFGDAGEDHSHRSFQFCGECCCDPG